MFWGVDRDFKEVIDAMEQVWTGAPAATSTTAFRESEQGYFLSVDLPGVKRADLDIQLEGDRLVVSATRKKDMLGIEKDDQKLTRSFVLPEHVDTEKIEAHLEDGVLYLALPKLEKAKPKKIELTSAAGESSWKNLLGFGKKEAKTEVV
jgi:HSP20 family protein